MKKSFLIALAFFALGSLIFTSCNTDEIGPKLYWKNSVGDYVQSGDTTILHYTKYVDPGVYAEDNVSKESNIIVENDAATVFSRYTTSEGYLRRAGDYTITYTATDEAGNKSEYLRNISIKNIADPFVQSYTTKRNSMHLNDDTTYNSNVATDNNIPGRLRFPKVYAHTWDGEKTYFRVNADLYDPDNLSSTFSETISFMGTSTDKDTPFFKDYNYTQGFDRALRFEMLKIDAQTYTDSTGTHSVIIKGVTYHEGNKEYPLSRIEYLANSTTITKIVLELNVTKNGIPDRVTETYIPKYD
ncbi:MAG: hypothetical protein PHE33_05735 [Bacteroidales bacterium]|nr:hypothetical protein [Bacteroidales bacterium]